jgi:hypothetical protein
VRRRIGIALLSLLAVGLLSACSIRQADVQTNTISAANPTAFHTESDTGVTRIGLAARDGRCASTFAGHSVRACRYFFKAALAGNTSAVHAIVPAGASTNPAGAYGDIPPNVGPVATVEAPDKISLQPQVKYRTQACAWVDYSDDGATGFQGPFCAGRDTNGDGSADSGTFGPEWITQTDPSGFNVLRTAGLIEHWADTTAERHVDVGNCISPTLLANNPGLAAGFSELNQWNVAGRLLVRNVPCAAANRDLRAFNQNQGANGVYGRASWDIFNDGHIVFLTPENPSFPNPTFFVNDFYVGQFPDNYDEVVVKHEIGHNLGIAHDDRSPASLMGPINFGTPTEVDQRQRNTINFLYGHTDSFNGNSGDSTPPARAGSSAASSDPVVRELRRRGRGARITVRQGTYETLTYVNRGQTTGVQFTVYAPNKEGRAAASAAASTAALLTP